MEDYVTIKEVCASLKISRETLRRWVNAGKLTAYKGDKIVRFKREDIDELLTPSEGK